ncbi:MAG: type III-B CRISPR module RAMP protein Cmr6 [Caldilineaceae bacterium]|nr:type III-B CRISPR module RAMP protein Cmr6 [Caldilineaceae bacterium]
MKWRLPRFLAWNNNPFPLPQDTAQIVLRLDGAIANPRALMNRFLGYEQNRNRIELAADFTNQKALLFTFDGQAELIAARHDRWLARVQQLGGAVLSGRPEWRILVGSGSHKILDTGFMLDQTSGLPLIPSSSLKGIVRHYAQAVEEAPADLINHLLGEDDENAPPGDLVFFDGVPTAPPVVEREVLNPLHSDYYRGQSVVATEKISARPTFFLTLGRASPFTFAVASRSRDSDAVEQGAEWLAQALQTLGVGAKTSAGYGFWVIDGGG